MDPTAITLRYQYMTSPSMRDVLIVSANATPRPKGLPHLAPAALLGRAVATDIR